MFSSKSKNSEPAVPTAANPGLQNGQTRRMPRVSSAPSLISADLVVHGTLTSTGDLQIDGRVEGDVHSAGLVIGDKAFIHGEVVADEVTVRGRVEGSIRARKVLLAATCHVEGNILHEAFAVEAGAFFEGNCRHSDNPKAEENRRTDLPERKPASAASQTPASAAPQTPSVGTTDGATPPMPPQAATYAPLKSGN